MTLTPSEGKMTTHRNQPKKPWEIDLVALLPAIKTSTHAEGEDPSFVQFYVDTHRPLLTTEINQLSWHLGQKLPIGDAYDIVYKEAVNTPEPLYRNYWRCKLCKS